ncbi:MAG TPA: UpxY family transcription antiterminator [Turneriella sp.]|nr:UpxY family transcription antiterminator [Turneriella sp.]
MHWYTLYTAPRAEKKLYAQLKKLSIEAYLPLIKQRNKWSDRYKWVEEPAFPSYIFVRLDGGNKEDFLKILRLPHARRFIILEGQVSIIPDADIELLRLSIDQYATSLKIGGLDDILVGEKVLITEGVFLGREAIVDAKEGKATVSVVFPTINQSLRVSIPFSYVSRQKVQ